MEPAVLFVLRNLTDVWCKDTTAKSVLANVIQGVLGLGMWLESVEGPKGAVRVFVTERAKRAAQVRHVENRDLKRTALAWYAAHKGEYRSKDEAAKAIAEKVVPASFSTVRKWLREPKRT